MDGNERERLFVGQIFLDFLSGRLRVVMNYQDASQVLLFPLIPFILILLQIRSVAHWYYRSLGRRFLIFVWRRFIP
jgi:hypothetical protein